MQDKIRCQHCGHYDAPYMTQGRKKRDFVLVCVQCGNGMRVVHGNKKTWSDRYAYLSEKDCDES